MAKMAMAQSLHALGKSLRALLDQLLIDRTGVVISLDGVGKFRCRGLGSFLRPALVYRRQAPLGTIARGADGLSPDHHKYRIRVGRAQYSQSNPTALFDRHVEGD